MKSINSKLNELKKQIDDSKIVELDRKYKLNEKIKQGLVRIYGVNRLLILSSTEAYHIRKL